jgi:hypothetical protein
VTLAHERGLTTNGFKLDLDVADITDEIDGLCSQATPARADWDP